jgi:hypothetical protein
MDIPPWPGICLIAFVSSTRSKTRTKLKAAQTTIMKPHSHSSFTETSTRQNPNPDRPGFREQHNWRRLRRKTRQVLHEALLERAWEGDLFSDLA